MEVYLFRSFFVIHFQIKKRSTYIYSLSIRIEYFIILVISSWKKSQQYICYTLICMSYRRKMVKLSISLRDFPENHLHRSSSILCRQEHCVGEKNRFLCKLPSGILWSESLKFFNFGMYTLKKNKKETMLILWNKTKKKNKPLVHSFYPSFYSIGPLRNSDNLPKIKERKYPIQNSFLWRSNHEMYTRIPTHRHYKYLLMIYWFWNFGVQHIYVYMCAFDFARYIALIGSIESCVCNDISNCIYILV